MKRKVLAGVNMVFSGIIALGAKPQDSDHWRLASLFGAQCSPDVSSKVTHVVASQVRLYLSVSIQHLLMSIFLERHR